MTTYYLPKKYSEFVDERGGASYLRIVLDNVMEPKEEIIEETEWIADDVTIPVDAPVPEWTTTDVPNDSIGRIETVSLLNEEAIPTCPVCGRPKGSPLCHHA